SSPSSAPPAASTTRLTQPGKSPGRSSPPPDPGQTGTLHTEEQSRGRYMAVCRCRRYAESAQSLMRGAGGTGVAREWGDRPGAAGRDFHRLAEPRGRVAAYYLNWALISMQRNFKNIVGA